MGGFGSLGTPGTGKKKNRFTILPKQRLRGEKKGKKGTVSSVGGGEGSQGRVKPCMASSLQDQVYGHGYATKRIEKTEKNVDI